MRLPSVLITLLTTSILLLSSCEYDLIEIIKGSPTDEGDKGPDEICVSESTATIPNTIELVKGDEWGNHGTYDDPTAPGIALPVYPGADFTYNGRVNTNGYYVPQIPIPRSSDNAPEYWDWTIPWGNVYYPQGEENRPDNLRIEIRNLRSYYFNQARKEWIQIDFTENEIAGAFYVNDFAGDANDTADIVTHPEQGSISVTAPPIGSVFHFFRGGANARNQVDDPANCVGFYTACEARLIRGNCSDDTDNRNSAELYLGMGLDIWATENADGNDPAFEYHQDAMFSRHRALDANWQTYNGVALINDGSINLDAYPPPLTDEE